MNVYFHAAAALLLRRNPSLPTKLETEWTPESTLALWRKISYMEGNYFRFSDYFGSRNLVFVFTEIPETILLI